MDNKRWFDEKLSEMEELENYISAIFTEYLEEFGYEPDKWTFWSWEDVNEDTLSITASYWNDREDDIFHLPKRYFYDSDPERRRNEMAQDYARKLKKEREEKERKEQERMQRKREQFEKLKQELGEA
jgi:predicted ribosome quality control (RQC) complex YloA/Tae2 family protein